MNNDTYIQEEIEQLTDFFRNATFEEIMQVLDKTNDDLIHRTFVV